MKSIRPFVSSNVADSIVAENDAVARARGALVVALQLNHSMAFGALALVCVVLGGGIALWLSSWTPIIVTTLVLAGMFYKLFISTAREIARTGIQQEFQAAYKRLYYSDPSFKKQVDDLRAGNK